MKFVGLIVLLMLFNSCWPSSISLIDKGSMPEEWKTFSLRTLENNAPSTPVSYAATLSERLKDGIQNNTRLMLNSETGGGEVVIEGKINGYSIVPIAIQPGDQAAKNRLTISCDFSILIREPKEEKQTLSVSRFVDFDAALNLASAENQLLEEINAQITQDVINKLLSNW